MYRSNELSLILLEHYVDAEDEPVELFVVTVEEESLFQAAYPDVVARYLMEKSEVLKKKQKSKSKSLSLVNLWVLPEYKKQKQPTFLPMLSNIMFCQDQGIILCFYCTILYVSTRKSELWLICHFDMPFLFFYR